MIRKYRAGDAFKVRVQPEQQAEAAAWAAEFEHIPAFALVEKGNMGAAADDAFGNMGTAAAGIAGDTAASDAFGNMGAAATGIAGDTAAGDAFENMCAAAGGDKTAGRQRGGSGGRVLAVFGFRIEGGDITTGREAECFALVGIDAGRKLIEAVRYFRRYIPRQAVRLGVRRVTMTVRRGFAAGARLAGMLGFFPAGILEKFFNGEDYQIFERAEKQWWHKRH